VANKVKFVDQGKTTPASSWSIADSNQERAISVKKVIAKSKPLLAPWRSDLC
jgi:hypothetical protein